MASKVISTLTTTPPLGGATQTASTQRSEDASGAAALSPTEVLRRARANVEHISRAGDLLVAGEASGPKVLPSGHITFELKDKRSRLPCIVFFNDTRRLKFELRHGMQIVVTGKPTVTEWSQVQLRVSRVEPVGEGALDLAFRQLKEKLEGEGLFAADKKRALPLLPRTVGVVTSSTGAAIQDVLKVLFDRMPGLHVVIAPTKVQGEGASADVAEAIRNLGAARAQDGSALCDVILVVRGGGSREDLWAFNTEPVARAIRGTRVPVIAGVGHESDVTIADLAADKRAATPSNAAEIAVPRVDDLVHRLDAHKRRLAAGLRHAVASARARVVRLSRRLIDPRDVIARKRKHVADLEQRLERALRKQRERSGTRLKRLDDRLR
ncbi:MAG TPA: exodeoxyribonuclease VII large subunit, partial [Myxococcota bacterium]